MTFNYCLVHNTGTFLYSTDNIHFYYLYWEYNRSEFCNSSSTLLTLVRNLGSTV